MPNGTIVGSGSRGLLRSGQARRVTGVYELGMAAYYDADEIDTEFFDEIVTSVCRARVF
jgi:hypothetical protein